MKRLLAMTALLSVQLGCVANQGAAEVRFLNARVITDGNPCVVSSNTYISGGALDLAGQDSYLLAMSVETNTYQQNLTVNQVNYQGQGLGDLNIYQIVYSYEFSEPDTGIVLPKEESVPIYFVFRPQTDSTASFLYFDAIGPQALEALQVYYRANRTITDPATPSSKILRTGTIVSHIKAKAYYSGGQETESNIIRFPVTLFASDYSTTSGCANPKTIIVSKCGRVGQDSSVCTLPPTTTTPGTSVPASSL